MERILARSGQNCAHRASPAGPLDFTPIRRRDPADWFHQYTVRQIPRRIPLTGREDQGQRVHMAGVPHHATERYVARLIKKGFRVALMDQVEDPKFAKGLVKRRVTRVMSRGTVFEDSLLDAKANNYLVAA